MFSGKSTYPFLQYLSHVSGGTGTVTDCLFDNRGKSSKSLMVFEYLEQRIVAETVCAIRFKTDATAASAARDGQNAAFDIGQNHLADVVSRATFLRHTGQSLQ